MSIEIRAMQFVMLGFVSVVLNTFADIVVAFAASGVRKGAAARPNWFAGCAKARVERWPR